MKILITGAGGFIGKNLTAFLQSLGEHEIFLTKFFLMKSVASDMKSSKFHQATRTAS